MTEIISFLKGRNIALLILLFSLIASCSSNKKNFIEEDCCSELGGKWVAIGINGDKIQVTDSSPHLVLDLETMKVSGSDGCNNIMSRIKKLTSTEIYFGLIAQTRLMCEETAIPNAFYLAIGYTHSYILENSELRFFDAEGKEILVFKEGD